MKRKFLLAVIPALMALSSCTYLESATVQKEFDYFKEDTLAHEELFGNSETALETFKLNPQRLASDLAEPVIGVQYREYNKEYEGQDRAYCAIRYVAKIASRHVQAEWIRGVSKQDAYQLKDKGSLEVTASYTSISNNGTPILAGSDGEGCFVVYTLYDIPLFDYTNELDHSKDRADCSWSYVAAGLKLTDLDDENETKMSKIVAVEIGSHQHGEETNRHCFSFYESELKSKDYFIQGIIEGSAQEVVKPLEDDPGDSNRAKGTFDFKANDNFGLFKWSASEFRFYGSFNRCYDHSFLEQNELISTNYVKVAMAHSYSIFVNNDGETSEYARYGLSPIGSFLVDIYLNPNEWDKDGAKFAIWAYDGSPSADRWFVHNGSGNKVGNYYVFSNVDVGVYKAFRFERLGSEVDDQNPSWTKWNESAEVRFTGEYVLKNKFTINECSGNNDSFTRSL